LKLKLLKLEILLEKNSGNSRLLNTLEVIPDTRLKLILLQEKFSGISNKIRKAWIWLHTQLNKQQLSLFSINLPPIRLKQKISTKGVFSMTIKMIYLP
jgi:hypothetical protein